MKITAWKLFRKLYFNDKHGYDKFIQKLCENDHNLGLFQTKSEGIIGSFLKRNTEEQAVKILTEIGERERDE